MERAPPEIWCLIAEFLPTGDLRSLRLTCKYQAWHLFHILARHFCVLGTLRCFKEFRSFLDTVPRQYTRRITIYNGRWPSYSRYEWERSSLMLSDRYLRTHQSSQGEMEAAYRRYRQFLSEKSQPVDAEVVREVLTKLPRLSSVKVSCLRPWTRKPQNPHLFALRNDIWVSPTFDGTMDGIM
ncbi:hypothetical protein Micbo1qcDRAFT_106441, partial [Microdochium bolleyi]